MHKKIANPSVTMAASTALIVACAMLAACDQIVTTAQAQGRSVSTPAAIAGDAKFFGDEYATQQASLVAGETAQAPTF